MPPLSFHYSHSNAVFSVWIEAFYGAIAIGILYPFEYLLPFHFHSHSIFQLVFEVLVGQVDEVKVDLAMGRHEVYDSILERVVGDVDDLLGNALDVSYKSRLFLYVGLILLSLHITALLVILLPCLFDQIDIQD